MKVGLLAAAIVLAGGLVGGRYSITRASADVTSATVAIVDRFTGDAWICVYTPLAVRTCHKLFYEK